MKSFISPLMLLAVVLSAVTITASARTLIQVETKTDRKCKIIEFVDAEKPQSRKTQHATWTGKCAGGYAHGDGTLITVNGEDTKEISKGEMVKGMLHGVVIQEFIKADGTRGTGRQTYSNGLPNGNGEIEIIQKGGEKFSYSGNFQAGQMSGNGVLTRPNEIITGKFLEGKP